jgi:hypothetical protein
MVTPNGESIACPRRACESYQPSKCFALPIITVLQLGPEKMKVGERDFERGVERI